MEQVEPEERHNNCVAQRYVPNRETSVQITVNIAVGEIRIAYSDVTCGELKDMKRNIISREARLTACFLLRTYAMGRAFLFCRLSRITVTTCRIKQTTRTDLAIHNPIIFGRNGAPSVFRNNAYSSM